MKAKNQSFVATLIMATLISLAIWFLYADYQKNGELSAGSHNTCFVSQN